ncbi:aldose 1-epimerase [Clostridium ljungdahlii]|uniref:aldose 1-epimerase n=1 Tax=Clostridium ljungdahlii TaxID=1538 RepID=UPI0007BF9753|nr:aldose 1-epimerase [Clostridium ljungdahlii]
MVKLPINEKQAASVEEVLWKGHTAVKFSAGGYEALIVPDVGANVIELKNTLKNISILRSPNEDLDFEAFKERPQIYGFPVLFPPNRIEDGTFKVGDKVYKFPINEPKRNNYIHGFIKSEKWQITKKEVISKDEVQVEAVFNFTKEHDFYKYLPHEFRFKLSYNLSCKGLKQTASVTNLSDEKMPIGIGYHTAFNVPFDENGNDEDFRVMASVDKRWEQNERNLPTGKILKLTEEEKKLLDGGMEVSGHPIETHYMLKNMNLDGKEFRGAVIEDKSNKLRVIYEMGADYKHLVIWNDTGNKHFVCIEPQTWVINAPNVKMSDDITGFKTLLPRKTWSEKIRIYVEM